MKRHQPPIPIEIEPDEAAGKGKRPAAPELPPADGPEPEFKVSDRRYWADGGEGSEAEPEDSGTEAAPRKPSIVDEYRDRTQAAESKLQEYIEAFKEREREQDQVRERLQRDVERRVDLKFGGLVAELIETMDDLDLSLLHLARSPQTESLARGVTIARDRFLATLERNGVERFDLDGTAFDPNVAEALRMDPVGDPGRNGMVTETLRKGYRLGERILRPAQVAVGRYTSEAS